MEEKKEGQDSWRRKFRELCYLMESKGSKDVIEAKELEKKDDLEKAKEDWIKLHKKEKKDCWDTRKTESDPQKLAIFESYQDNLLKLKASDGIEDRVKHRHNVGHRISEIIDTMSGAYKEIREAVRIKKQVSNEFVLLQASFGEIYEKIEQNFPELLILIDLIFWKIFDWGLNKTGRHSQPIRNSFQHGNCAWSQSTFRAICALKNASFTEFEIESLRNNFSSGDIFVWNVYKEDERVFLRTNILQFCKMFLTMAHTIACLVLGLKECTFSVTILEIICRKYDLSSKVKGTFYTEQEYKERVLNTLSNESPFKPGANPQKDQDPQEKTVGNEGPPEISLTEGRGSTNLHYDKEEETAESCSAEKIQ
ncbi:hypothetical protein PROFUN_16026 [Planoprotostelium fungivorum]|uniref:Uncharacterized protein n=1 Tax=Planoprotostelium fungivorum TaxID=1890364 RepID=A0A2P6MTD6_9EUKA|nr:hypothetical protein PROFUN_16026 [Planoprotostelium fungivorum]